jgi:hypothetical protein
MSRVLSRKGERHIFNNHVVPADTAAMIRVMIGYGLMADEVIDVAKKHYLHYSKVKHKPGYQEGVELRSAAYRLLLNSIQSVPHSESDKEGLHDALRNVYRGGQYAFYSAKVLLDIDRMTIDQAFDQIHDIARYAGDEDNPLEAIHMIDKTVNQVGSSVWNVGFKNAYMFDLQRGRKRKV